MFKLEGSADCYLFVKPGKIDIRDDFWNWSIWSDLKGSSRYIKSASASQVCPAHAKNKSNQRRIRRRIEQDDWSFTKVNNGVRNDEERGGGSRRGCWIPGGFVITCTVHGEE